MMMVGRGPLVVGKLRKNLVSVNERSSSIADSVIRASSSIEHSSMEQEHKRWRHPEPYVRNLIRKFSLKPTSKGVWTRWDPDKQMTYCQLWTRLRPPPLGGTGKPTVRRMTADNHQITTTAAFAVAEFNEKKNAQLRFIRAVRGFCSSDFWGTDYFLTLEADDDTHGVRTYQAVVKKANKYPHDPFMVLLFGLISDNGHGNLLNLFDNRNGPFGEYLFDSRGVVAGVQIMILVVPSYRDGVNSSEDEMLSRPTAN